MPCYTTTKTEPVATSIVAPTATLTVPINNPFLPAGTFILLLISLSIRSAPSVIAMLPNDCNAPSEFAVPTACAVPTPTTLLVATPTESDAQVPAAPTPPPPPPWKNTVAIPVEETKAVVTPGPAKLMEVTPVPTSTVEELL